MKFFVTDLKRAFSEPTFFLSLVLGIISLFGGMAYLMISGNSVQGLYASAQSLVLPFAAPLLAAMPYSSMIMQERETRYRIMMNVKLRKKGFEFKRLAVCGISGAAVLLLPQLALFAVCAVMGEIPDLSSAAMGLVLPVTFGFGYAAFSYGLTFVNRQRYVPMVMPQVLYLLCVYAFPHIRLERFYPPLDISPAIYGGEITGDRFAVPAVLTVAAVILTLYGAIRRESIDY